MRGLRILGATLFVAGIGGGAMSSAGCARTPSTDDPNAASSDEALTGPVGTLASGTSDIEGRTVYAPANEGEISYDMTNDISLPGELNIEEPSMLKGGAHVDIKYSKKANTVKVHLTAKGLPYRHTFTKNFNDSTQFNPQLTQLADAHWQFWLFGTTFGRYHELVYYDATTLAILGTQWDFAPYTSTPFPAAGTYISAPVNGIRMICSPEFEGKPNGDLDFEFTLQYDHIADAVGSPGVVNLVMPFSLCEPDGLSNYWSSVRLPDSMFMTWDYYLQSVWNGEGIGSVFTAEPPVKPPPLTFRDNDMVGWGQIWPQIIPKGTGMDFLTAANGTGGGSLRPIHGSTYQLAPWPPSTRHNCGGG